jgi:hypothetical protein
MDACTGFGGASTGKSCADAGTLECPVKNDQVTDFLFNQERTSSWFPHMNRRNVFGLPLPSGSN